MGADAAAAATRQQARQDPLLARFARLMRDRYAARVYLFGSRARGTATAESDYDVVVVSRRFEGQRRISRAVDLYAIWHEAGGWGIGLDVHCYTPEEFRAEAAGLGCLGHAKRRGELIRLGTRGAA